MPVGSDAIRSIGMDEQFLEALTADYERLGADLLEPLVEVFRVARQIGGGDIDKVMIMMVVGLRTLAHPVFRTQRLADVLRKEPLAPTLGVNSRSLADALAIPRETVRRKVAELIEGGWLARERYTLHYTAQAMRDLTPFRTSVIRLAAAYDQCLTRYKAAASSA